MTKNTALIIEDGRDDRHDFRQRCRPVPFGDAVNQFVWGDDISDPVSMNASNGFMPKTFGYFGFDEFRAAMNFAPVDGGGWLSEPAVIVDITRRLFPLAPIPPCP